ncbi:MAG: MarC family protein [Streptomycetaceae bacterium]|nr:MarC family protein [Streptomycetaceae bacterium]
MPVLNFTTAFVTFFAVIGPPKVMLAFAHLATKCKLPQMRRLALLSTLIAASAGVVMAYAADHVMGFFHISDESLQLAGGVIFFIYAIALVMGIRLGGDEDHRTETKHPMASALRELSLPYVASPLAITAVLVESLAKNTWSWSTTIASAYLSVLAIDCVCLLLLMPLLQRTHETGLEVLSRLLGLLLAAVGVELFLDGLAGLGVPLLRAHY